MSTDNTETTALTEQESQALLTVYTEICKSYQAVDDFRTKLLGFLPLTSLVSIFILNPESVPAVEDLLSKELLGFASIFAALLTLGLFGYEVRGIRRSDDLIRAGSRIEKQLGIYGQFHVCQAAHRRAQKSLETQKSPGIQKLSGILRRSLGIFNSKLLACIIYSVVFAAWVFLALRLGWGFTTFTCYKYATIAGLALAFGVYQLVAENIPA
jgi:hypothetical protein